MTQQEGQAWGGVGRGTPSPWVWNSKASRCPSGQGQLLWAEWPCLAYCEDSQRSSRFPIQRVSPSAW